MFFNLSVLNKDGFKNRFPSILDVQENIVLREPLTFKRCNWGKLIHVILIKIQIRKYL